MDRNGVNRLELTTDQRAAADIRGRPLLVSAGAGAGKTRVLVERLMGYLSEPGGGHGIDRFLLITYTRAAAGEMRERILNALRERLADQPERLLRQTALAHNAWICTLHAYCLEIYREHCAAAGPDAEDSLPPDLRMGDETELALLRLEALDDTLDEWFDAPEDGGPGHAALTDMGVDRRGDRRLGELVYAVWEKTRAYQTADWERRCLDIAGREVWEPALLEDARRELALWQARLTALRFPADSGPKDAAQLSDLHAQLSGLLSAAHRWDTLSAALADVRLPARRPGHGQSPSDVFLQALRRRLESLRHTFSGSADEGEADARAALPAARALLEAARRFDRRYSDAKAGRKLMDYHDLERFALRVLSGPDGGPSAVARKISRRFIEIFVDEYQDINPLQDRIVRLLSREGRNVFRVGDVRQSVYRFQNADPGLFMEKYARYARWRPDSPPEDTDSGLTVSLSDNFRSRPEILDAVNFVFARLMAPGSGEAAYEPLRAGRGAAARGPDALAGVEWLVTDLSDSDGEEDLAAEARTVARRLRELIAAGGAGPE
ncbi:MAG: UvrD-helicase domain-containing protein, partial [Oscillospiraceae bacterium]|nr:UvrD-helicase domain-containing protein [Oscillospiraceae bacterium]